MTLSRGFLAIPVPQPVRLATAKLQAELSAHVENLRWSHPDTLHLTLHFFGRITEENLEKIKASMLSVRLKIEPFQVDIQGLGVFPNIHRPRVLWLGLKPTAPLRALCETWRESLGQTGMQAKVKPFAPHLTIGRFRRAGGSLGKLLADPAGALPIEVLTVDRLILYESRLTPRRAEHIPVHSVLLGS